MLVRDMLRKCETQTGSFLLPLTDKRFEQAIANSFRYASAVVRDGNNTVLLSRLERNGNDRLRPSGACGLAGVEQQIVDRAFDLFAINERCALGRVAERCDDAHALRVR